MAPSQARAWRCASAISRAVISTLISVAGLFVLLRAEFLAGVQVFVYVGGVMVLFLFVIMLVNVGREESGETRVFTKHAAVAIVASVALAAAFVFAVRSGERTLSAGAARPVLVW